MDVLNIFCWDETQSSIDKLQDLLKCQLCNNAPTSPVLLSACQHSFCGSCLATHKGDPDVCPQCNQPSMPINARPDRITAELSAAAQQLRSLLKGEQLECFLNKGDQEDPVDPVISCNPVTNDTSTAQLKANKKICKQSGTTGRPKPVFQEAQPHSLVPSTPLPSPSTVPVLQRSAPSEPPFTPPVNIAPPPSALLHKKPYPSTPDNRGVGRPLRGAATPNTANNAAGMRCAPPATPRLDKRNAKGETALHVACVKGNEETVRRLIAEGANPNSRDHAGWTPLHEACQHGHLAIAELLLLAGALPNAPSHEGNATPLHDAVEHGRDEVIRVLRRYGARDDLRDIHGNTARQLASLCQGPRELLAALDTSPDQQAMAAVKPGRPQERSVVLTGSNLTPHHTKLIAAFAKSNKLRLLPEYSSEVSHVVLGCEESRPVCLRTAKFMMGVVAGKWLLSHGWLDACLAAGCIVDPQPYEVTGSTQNANSGAPRRARLNADKMLPGLLSGCHVYLHGNFSNNCPSKRDLEGLVRAGGGRLLNREPNAEAIPATEQTVPYHAAQDSPLARCSHYIVYQEGSDAEPKLKYDMPHIKSLPLTWLIDCIDHFQLLPPFPSA